MGAAKRDATSDKDRESMSRECDMSSEEKHVRAVIEGCAERGVRVSDRLASAFVSILLFIMLCNRPKPV